MYEVGTVCVKIAGRDAGKQCVIVEAAKDGFVVIEGATRRRKCNVRHLEILDKEVKVKAGASHAEVMKALGLKEKESKSRKPAAKPSAHASRAKKAPATETTPAKKKAAKNHGSDASGSRKPKVSAEVKETEETQA
jgi:large subunit ribosomal protein L14e